jgi:hypothetical protein
MPPMRTTLTIDDQLLAELNERALRRGLQADTPQAPRKPFRAKTFAMGQPLVPSLDKSLALAAALEDEEIARKLALRK